MPDATILADFMAARATGLVEGLVVHPAPDAARTSIAPAACTSPRPCCSRWSRPACRARRPTCWCSAPRSPRSARRRRTGTVGARPGRFRELLGDDPDVTSRLDAKALDACFDLDHHLRHAPEILERALRSEAAHDRSRRRSLARASSRHPLEATPWTAIGGRTLPRYDGKVRDCYIDTRARRARSSSSPIACRAFDAVVGTIPFKGQVLNQLAPVLVRADQAHRAEPHAARARSERDGRARVRAAAGRARDARVPDGRDLDVDLEGLRGRRPHVLRPRAARGHEEEPAAAAGRSSRRRPRPPRATTTSRSRATSCSRWAGSSPSSSTAPPRSPPTLFADGQRHAAAAGLILADTKYEMGLAPDGTITVIDEIHTPDSSRYWYADDYEARLATRRGAAQPRQGVRPPLARRRGEVDRATARRR